MKNSLLGKCGHLVRAKQRWDIGRVKLRGEGLASEREDSADGAVGKAELFLSVLCKQSLVIFHHDSSWCAQFPGDESPLVYDPCR